MSRQVTPADSAEDRIDEAQVLAYLRDHPDLLQRHQDVLMDMKIPHNAGGQAVSLIEYQVSLLRTEAHTLGARLEELVVIARDNDRLAEQLHRFTLELLSADDLESIVVALRDGLRQDFRADVVQVVLIGDQINGGGVPVVATDDPQSEQLSQHFPDTTPVLGALDAERMTLVFGEQAKGLASAAIIPMDEPPLRGYIAIGSQDAERYHSEQGTVFLTQLGAIVARVLRRALLEESA